MIASLRQRPVQKLPDTVRFPGRVLFHAEDAALVRDQLAGEDLAWTPATPLRDNISTDEITPAYICYYYDETLGEFPYLGLKCGNEFPVSRGAIKRGGFVASVSGKRRGKGSSREQSPYAEMCAGIRLVVAENIERIYRENCQNLGIFTTTDFSVIERVRGGEDIPLTTFTAGEGEITRGIIEYGGLFNYNVARLQGRVTVAPPATTARPMTLGEKILARHWVVDASSGKVGVPAVQPGDEGFVVTDIRFSHEYVTPMAAIFFEQLVGPDERVTDPGSVLMFRDHLTFLPDAMTPERVKEGLLDVALELEKKQRAFAERQGIKLYGELRLGRHGSEAICHSKILESHALPGHVIIGSDSHTPHAGAVGCVAFGVGTTAIFNSWITKDVRVTVPETVLVRVRGRKPENVTAKDFMLEILRHPYVKSGRAIGKLVEYCGPAVETLVAARERLPKLRAIFLGDIISEECEISWIRQSDVSPLLEAYPKLEQFWIRGADGLALGNLRHERLRTLVIQSRGLAASVVRQVAAAHLPELEHLELWLGESYYDGDATINDLMPILSGEILPRLQYLGLRNSEIADEIAAYRFQTPDAGEILHQQQTAAGMCIGDDHQLQVLMPRGHFHGLALQFAGLLGTPPGLHQLMVTDHLGQAAVHRAGSLKKPARRRVGKLDDTLRIGNQYAVCHSFKHVGEAGTFGVQRGILRCEICDQRGNSAGQIL